MATGLGCCSGTHTIRDFIELARAAEEDAAVLGIYADWLEENGQEEAALWLRDMAGESGFSDEIASDGDSNAYGRGNGYGDGGAHGRPHGFGDGRGDGKGDGAITGFGYGTIYGYADGNGYGYGDGYPDGDGYSTGNGYWRS